MAGNAVSKTSEKPAKKKVNRNYLYFITPGFIFYSIFIVLPIAFVIVLAFTDWSGLGAINFIGIENFITIFTDSRFSPTFFNAIWNNIKYLLCVWFIITPFQYLVAYVLYRKFPAHNYIKFMVFLPYVISSAIVGFFATLIFDPNLGFLNDILEALGLPTGAWFGDANWAFPLLIIVIIWQSSGSGILIFYSNFVDLSEDVMEASMIDGCTEWQRFWNILLPMSLPSCASNITMNTIWALAIFDLPFILGGTNGGVSGSLDFINTVFYRYTFGSGLNGKSDMGFGASICLVVLVIMLVLTAIQNKLLDKFDYNKD